MSVDRAAEMAQEIVAALKGRVDYLEIRVESTRSLSISWLDGGIDFVRRGISSGGCVRACRKGGWGFCSFNDLALMREFASEAVHQARLAGTEKTVLAAVEPVQAEVDPPMKDDPLRRPMDDKLRLVSEYGDLVMSVEGITGCRASYSEVVSSKLLVTSEGTHIVQRRTAATVFVTMDAVRHGCAEKGFVARATLSDFSRLAGLHDRLAQEAAVVSRMPDAPQLEGGVYTVVLDGGMGGLFVHEAFGHNSEADHQIDSPRLLEMMERGRRFGPSILTIYDSGRIEDSYGYIEYDDEGVPASRTDLIREGVLVGKLHSRETAGRLGERPTGNARAVGYAHPPIVRMRTTCIEPGEASLEELFDGIEKGVYCIGGYGGMGGETFSFTALRGRMIRGGKPAEYVRDVKLVGNVFETLHKVEAVGDESTVELHFGACGKGGQMGLPVGQMSPHLRIAGMAVGGG